MSIFIIADLHLSFNENKPMNIFGEKWNNHSEKIKKNWKKNVKEQDLVVIPGDFSWAMHLKDTYEDFKFLNDLPGKKVLIKGNHDYWWTTLKSMKKFLDENNFKNIDFIQNNSIIYDNIIICGTRGWTFLESENGKKMINRENDRLKLSLVDGITKHGNDKKIIVCMHYPPYFSNEKSETDKTLFIETMKDFNVKDCFYGHLHGNSHKDCFDGNIEGINMKLISADFLNFNPYKIV